MSSSPSSKKSQSRFHNRLTGGCAFPVDPGRVDGDCGSRTIKAIDNIQRWFFHSTDSRIDPEGQTIKNIRDILIGHSELYVTPSTNKNLVALMEKKVGQVYFYGASVPKWNVRWMGPWDCAEFVAWGLNLTCGGYLGNQIIGCRKRDKYHNAYTGHFLEDFKTLSKIKNPKNAKQKVVEKVDIEYAKQHAGVVGVKKGHIYVSAGGGATIEAAGNNVKRAVPKLSVRKGYSFWKVNLLSYV